MVPKLPSFEMLNWSKLLILVFAMAIMITSVYIKDLMDQIIFLEKSLHLVQLDIKSTQRKQEIKDCVNFVILLFYADMISYLYRRDDAPAPALSNFLNTFETIFYKIRSGLEKKIIRRKFYETPN
jgi:hypothetical protein